MHGTAFVCRLQRVVIYRDNAFLSPRSTRFQESPISEYMSQNLRSLRHDSSHCLASAPAGLLSFTAELVPCLERKSHLATPSVQPLLPVLDLYSPGSPRLISPPRYDHRCLSSCLFVWDVPFQGRTYILSMDAKSPAIIRWTGWCSYVWKCTGHGNKLKPVKSTPPIHLIVGARLPLCTSFRGIDIVHFICFLSITDQARELQPLFYREFLGGNVFQIIDPKNCQITIKILPVWHPDLCEVACREQELPGSHLLRYMWKR